MFSGARVGGGFSPVAEEGLWVDMRAKPDSAASLDRAARIRPPSARKHKQPQRGETSTWLTSAGVMQFHTMGTLPAVRFRSAPGVLLEPTPRPRSTCLMGCSPVPYLQACRAQPSPLRAGHHWWGAAPGQAWRCWAVQSGPKRHAKGCAARCAAWARRSRSARWPRGLPLQHANLIRRIL